jgi:phage terminase small subunit
MRGNARGGAGRDAEGLTRYERRFVDEYLIDLNGTASMRRMGYKGDNPRVQAYEMRHRPHVDAAIEAAIVAQRQRLNVTADQVIEQYRRIAFADVKHLITIDEDGNQYIDIAGLPDDRSCTISSFEAETDETPAKDGEKAKRKLGKVKIRMKDSLHALDKLGVHLKIFADDQAPSIPVRFIIEGLPGASTTVTVKPEPVA